MASTDPMRPGRPAQPSPLRGEGKGRGALCALGALAIAVVMLACGGTATRTAKPTESDAVLFIDCPVRDASVWVNDRYVASVAELEKGLALEPGRYRVEVRHDRYHSFYARMKLERRERRHLAVQLAELLP